MKLLHNRSFGRCALWGVAVALALWGGRGFAQENIGKIQQGLVGGEEVSEKTQEAYGLLSLSSGGSCSASLLRNDWAITAAHCVEAKDRRDNTMPDPARPGQNVLDPINNIQLTAVWGGGQTRRAVRVETFRPYDVALIKLDSPILVNGKNNMYVREVFLDQFPYFGTPVGVNITVFGRGINQFAMGTGDTATPSQMDGKFRMGKAKTTREEGLLYWYPSDGKLMIAGGDSGGPTFATVGTNMTSVLVGVHSLAKTKRVAGKPDKGWTWVTATPEAADAPIKPVWAQIEQIMGPRNIPKPPPVESDNPTPVFQYTVPFGTAAADRFFILYGVKPDGTLVWHRHVIQGTGPTAKHVWNPTKNVGTGWKAGLQAVLPAGLLAMYALQDDGTMRWYWHTGATDGSFRWRDPQTIKENFGSYWRIMPMDNGVVYTVLNDGFLRWTKYINFQTGLGGSSLWMAPKNVGWGWRDGYKTVFAGGKGVLYSVRDDGVLMWNKHKEYLKPPSVPANNASNETKLKWQNSWAESKVVGYGWDDMPQLFSAGEGYIYGIRRNGDLMWFHHKGWETGAVDWEANQGIKIASGWNGYTFAFARITSGDLGSGNREVDIVVH